jgi:hypothetical protein
MTMSNSGKRSLGPRKAASQSKYNRDKELRKSLSLSSPSSQSSTSDSSRGERSRHITPAGSRSHNSRSRSRSPDYDRHSKRSRNDNSSYHDDEGESSNEEAALDSREDSNHNHTGSEHGGSHPQSSVSVPVTPIIDQVEILREENENLKKAVETLEKTSKLPASGKNKLRKYLKRDMKPQDHYNLLEVNTYLVKKVLPHVKFFPHRWWIFSEKKKTICGRVMKQVTVPPKITAKWYWHNWVAIWINDKLIAMRSNNKEDQRKQYFSE